MSVAIWCFAVARAHVPKAADGSQDERLVDAIALSIWVAHCRADQ